MGRAFVSLQRQRRERDRHVSDQETQTHMIHRSCRVICESRLSASVLSHQVRILSAGSRSFLGSQDLNIIREQLNCVHASGTLIRLLQCRALLQPQVARQQRSPIRQARAASSEAAMAIGSVVKDLQPAVLWRYFEEITKIPRPSKHEER